jgi:hypothetical protein
MTTDPQDLVTSSGTVECTDCGHEIETGHDLHGCSLCRCTQKWKRADKITYRRSLGLPGDWHRRRR